jgi:hypothetical protein
MHLRTLIVVVLLLVVTTSFGQETPRFETAVPRHAIRISPLHLLSFYPTIQVGYETLIYKKFTTYVEGGYVFENSQAIGGTNDQEFENKRGFKMKLEPRWYALETESQHVTFYLALEFYVNRVNFDRTEKVVECYDADCVHSYETRRTYIVKYREHGLAPKWGMMVYMGRIFLDLNAGFAIRNVDYIKPNIPAPIETAFFFFDFAETPNEEKRTVLAPVFGGRIGYRFK